MSDQKIIVVTGANSGIGKAMTAEFAKRGHRVVMACRNQDSANQVREQVVQETGNQNVEVMKLDLAEPESIAAFGAEFRKRFPKLDILMNNAGLYLSNLQRNSRGHEMMMAINHFGTYLVTQELLEPLKAAQSARIVTTASGAHHWGRINPDDLDVGKYFIPMFRYGQSKLANILFTRALAKRLKSHGITATCFHPGAVATGFAQDDRGTLNALMQVGKYLLISSQRGADTGIFLALDDTGAPGGDYYYKRKIGFSSGYARNNDLAERLWDATERTISVK